MKNEKKRVALLSVFAAVFLTGIKIIIGLLTGSLGILSEALHSGLDLVAAIITFFSVRISDKPADVHHHYGHGKVENLSAFIQTILLIITCIWILTEATSRLVSGNTHIEVNVWSYLVVITSILIDFSRSRALKKAAKKHNSQALEADALHFSSDIWSSFVVLVGLILAEFQLHIADSIAAMAVALIVLYVSYSLGKRAIDVLLDKAPKESYLFVLNVLKQHPEIIQYHNVGVRTAGADTFVKFNIHVSPEMSVTTMHALCDEIEHTIKQHIPRCEVYIHAEPETAEHLSKEMK